MKNDANQQRRDIALWGSGAVLAVSLAAVSYFLGAPTGIVTTASLEADNFTGIDRFVTGSVPKENKRRVRTTLAAMQPYPGSGTTIAVREAVTGDNSALNNQPQQIGINLGSGRSFTALGKRYLSLVESAPTLFTALKPRAAIVDVKDGIEAQLIAGPIKDMASAKHLCENIQLRFNTKCTPTNFIGQALKLN